MSADDVDEELMAMVGGDSSDDEGEIDATQQFEDRSPTPEAAPVKSSVEKGADSGPRRGVAQKVKPKRGKKARRRESSEEEDAVASAASSPPQSLGSGAMDQSDSEPDAAASPGEDEAPLYPVEGKFTSTSDRAHILGLPEIEREEILAERAAEVTRRQQDLQLKRALAATREKAKSHKRKAVAAELEDDSSKRSSRPKVEKTGRSALDDYKRAREQREQGKTRVDTRRDRREDRSPSSASDRDADAESEPEWAEPMSDNKRDEPPADLKDFNRCHVGRSNFAKVCFYPNFESAIKGCFARVSIGPDKATGHNMYRMTQIKGFVEGKPYKLEGANGKNFTTDVYALVAHGGAEKPWPFLACSDSKFTDIEFDRYTATLQKENLRMPSRKFINGKLDDIHHLLNRSWTEEDIQTKINKQRAMAKKYDPANAANLQREKINNRRTIAQENEDAEEVAKCDAELAALENQRLNPPATTAPKGGPVQPERKREQDRLAELNHQTRRTNAEEVRKALVEEKRKIQRAREKAIAEAKAKAAAKAAEEEARKNGLQVPGDLFGEGSDISRAGTPGVANGAKKSRAGTPANGGSGKKAGGVFGKVGGRKMEDEIVGSMDLGMDDIEI